MKDHAGEPLQQTAARGGCSNALLQSCKDSDHERQEHECN